MCAQSTPGFVPKQAYPHNADIYEEIVANSTSIIAERFLRLIQPLPPTAVIHDNGCGGGQVIKKIVETQNASAMRFEATDIDPTQVSSCRNAATIGEWPARVAEMPAE